MLSPCTKDATRVYKFYVNLILSPTRGASWTGRANTMRKGPRSFVTRRRSRRGESFVPLNVVSDGRSVLGGEFGQRISGRGKPRGPVIVSHRAGASRVAIQQGELSGRQRNQFAACKLL